MQYIKIFTYNDNETNGNLPVQQYRLCKAFSQGEGTSKLFAEERWNPWVDKNILLFFVSGVHCPELIEIFG